MKAVLEIGVNQGQHTLGLLEKYNCKLFGFEPVQSLEEKLKQKFKQYSLIEIFPYAIHETEGTAEFHLSSNDEKTDHQYGCSSLYHFNDNINKLWPNRNDFTSTKTELVKKIRLDTFIEEKKITSIEYMHCDAQGSDLSVLRSLGKYASILNAGVVEGSNKIDLYSGTDNSVESIQKWLSDHNFNVTRTKNSDPLGAEMNIYFERNK